MKIQIVNFFRFKIGIPQSYSKTKNIQQNRIRTNRLLSLLFSHLNQHYIFHYYLLNQLNYLKMNLVS
jgi:hypothetical protein